MKLLALILSFSICSSCTGIYSQGYKIDVAIKDKADDNIVLAIYSGLNKYNTIDSVQLDKKGKVTFSGKKALAPGMYLIKVENEIITDFLISGEKNQTFSINVKNNVSIKNSRENQAFLDFNKFMAEKQKKEAELVEKSKSKGKDISSEMSQLSASINSKIEEINSKYPGSLLSSIASTMSWNRTEISQKGKEYYKIHYWDNIPLDDNRIQNTPILTSFIDNYFDLVLEQQHDSIIKGVDLIVSKAERDTAMCNYLINYIFDKYVESEMLGLDNVLVYMVDNYYSLGKAKLGDDKDWVMDYAKKHRNTLIGEKAKNLKMETINGMYESLFDFDNQYTLVYFFEPSCGQCSYETPLIYKVFEKYKSKGLAGMCVYTQRDKTEWLSYVTKNKLVDWINVWDPQNENNFRIAYSIYSVPQVYLLDKDKRIVGRRLDHKSLAKLLEEVLK